MIKFENTEVFNFEGAIRGMRNPMNSWDKSDSEYTLDWTPKPDTGIIFNIGDNDLALMKKLIKAGPDHRKFMRQILVSVDITAPLYWWKEMDQYRVAVVSNSCSTMHKLTSKPFEMSDFSHDKLVDECKPLLQAFICGLNECRNIYIEDKNKDFWYSIIQLLPSSYNQKRTVTLNYETILNIRGSRRNHKLDEWRIGFMEWIDSLPYAEELLK